jgi:hypothetical protein
MSIRGHIAAQMFGSFARMNNLFPLQKPPHASESPEAENSEKSMVRVAATLMTKDALNDTDSHPTGKYFCCGLENSDFEINFCNF